jgi:hypothetical protein
MKANAILDMYHDIGLARDGYDKEEMDKRDRELRNKGKRH